MKSWSGKARVGREDGGNVKNPTPSKTESAGRPPKISARHKGQPPAHPRITEYEKEVFSQLPPACGALDRHESRLLSGTRWLAVPLKCCANVALGRTLQTFEYKLAYPRFVGNDP